MRAPVRACLSVILVAAAYYAAGRLGLVWTAFHPASSALWPASGVALAAVLLGGPRVLAGVALGAFAVALHVLEAPGAALAIAAGNTTEAAVGAWFVQRFAAGRAFAESGRSAFLFCVLGGGAAPALAAAVGAVTLGGHTDAWLGVADIAGTWWLGDMGGVLIVAPLVMLARYRSPVFTWNSRRRGEFLLMLAGLGAVGGAIFFLPAPDAALSYPLAFMALPLAVWAAFRFTVREAALVNALLALLAVVGVGLGGGPFAALGPAWGLVLSEIFVAAVCVTTLPLAAGVHERRMAEAALREVRQALEARVAERTAELEEAQTVGQVGTWRWDIETDRITWNLELYRIFGQSPQTFRPTFAGYRGLLEPDVAALIEEKVKECIATGGSYRVEHRVLRPDGTVSWLDGRGRAVHDAQGRLVRLVGTAQEITERKQAELEARRLNEELEHRIEERTRELARANAELESFNYSVSHDLRGPLRNVGGFAEILLEELGTSASPGARKHLERIVLNVKRMSDIISGMLALANAGRGQLESVEIDLSRLAGEVAADLHAHHPGREVVCEVAPDLHVTGDARLMRVLVTNLLANAWKFTARRNGEARVEVGLLSGPEGPELFVRDNGAGFDERLSAQLFLPFRRLHQRNDFDGTGIGLATVARIAERHKGGVRATGTVGQGATFYVRLPSLRVQGG